MTRLGFLKTPGFFIVTIRAMFTAAFAAVAAFEMVLFGKDNIPFGTVIKILGIELFVKHEGKNATLSV